MRAAGGRAVGAAVLAASTASLAWAPFATDGAIGWIAFFGAVVGLIALSVGLIRAGGSEARVRRGAT